MPTILILVLTACAAVFATVIVCLPRALIRPACRSALWRLRDEVWDARRNHQLPDDVSTMSLIHRIEATIGAAQDVTLTKLVWSVPSVNAAPPEVRREIRATMRPDISALSSEQRHLVSGFVDRLHWLMLATTFFGSWSGIAVVVVLIPILPLIAIAASFSSSVRHGFRHTMKEGRDRAEEVALERAFCDGPSTLAGV
jgi:uncharacterized membrane protein